MDQDEGNAASGGKKGSQGTLGCGKDQIRRWFDRAEAAPERDDVHADARAFED